MKKLIVFFIFLFFMVGFLYAKEDGKDKTVNKEIYQKAINFYKAKDYSSAIRNYNILILNGIRNSDIYYNLSLSYTRLGEYGKASLNIERALRLSPRDKDIRSLRLELSRIIKEPKENIAEKIISQLKLVSSLNELTIILFTIFFISCFFISLYCFYYKKIYIKVATILLACFVVIVPLIYMKINDELLSKEAVIIVKTPVRNKPIKNEEASFEIVAGRKVTILQELGRWKNIKSSIDGFSGWVDKSSLELI